MDTLANPFAHHYHCCHNACLFRVVQDSIPLCSLGRGALGCALSGGSFPASAGLSFCHHNQSRGYCYCTYLQHVHCIFFFAYIFMYLHCCLELGYAFCQKLVDIMYCICVNKYLQISTRCVELFAVTLEIAHGTCQILQKCQNAPGSHGA